MPSRLLNWALKQNVRGPAKCILLVLAIRAEKTDCPSLTDITNDSGLARSTVVECLQDLEDMKIIRRERHGTTNTVYAFQLVRVADQQTSPPDGPVASPRGGSPPGGLVRVADQLAERKESNQRKERSPSITHISNTVDSARQARPTKVPEDFSVTEKMLEWATEKGFTAYEIQEQTELMIDHFRGTGKPHLDWVATWRNWLRNSRGRFNGNGRGYDTQTKVDRTLQRARELMREFDLQDRRSGERGTQQSNDGGLRGAHGPSLFGADPSGDDSDD